MSIKIGFIGYGVVGQACHLQFLHNSIALIIDPKHAENTWADLFAFHPSLIFISLPAPTLDDGSVDVSLIHNALIELMNHNYSGLVVIKSTIPPNSIFSMVEQYSVDHHSNGLRLLYSPEFLTQREWRRDAVNPIQIVIAGPSDFCFELEDIYRNHSHVATTTRYEHVPYKIAALSKYVINAFLAMKVVFMNQVQALLNDTIQASDYVDKDIAYDMLMYVLGNDARLGNTHMEVPGPDGHYGYGGSCLPKDVKALIGYDFNQRMTLIQETQLANTKIRLS